MQFGHRLGLGVVGGVIGLAAMEIIRRTTAPLVKDRAPEPTDVFLTERTMSPLGPKHEPGEGATEAIGRIAYERIAGETPSQKTTTALSWAVHVLYGLAVAGLYGVVRGRKRHVLRDGALFGAGLWALGDELAVPLLGLSDKPTSYSVSRHAQSLAQHLGFGVATAAATHALEGRR